MEPAPGRHDNGAQVSRILFDAGEVEIVTALWSGFEFAWASGRGAAQDFSTPDYGLNISFLGQEASRSRIARRETLERPLEPGDVILNSGEPLVWVESPAAFEGLNISLSPEAMARFGALSGLGLPQLRPASFQNDDRLLDIARIVADEMRSGAGGPLFRDALVNLLLAHLIERYGVSQGPRESGRLGGKRLRTVLDYVEEQLGTALSLNDLAGRAGMSSFHFARQFKLATGLPPHRYVTLRRMKRAQTLLADRSLSVAQVAFAVGYLNTRHFSDQFRRATGRTPGAFRAERG